MSRAICRTGPERHAAGFVLIEVMIALAVVMLFVGFGLAWYQAEAKRTARAELIEEQAIEMATLARALEQYLDSAEGLPASGGFNVAATDIEAAGFLPNLYLRPSGEPMPVSPLGQAYVLRGVYQTERYRGIVVPTGYPHEALLSRYGLKGSVDDMFTFAAKVMQRMAAAHYATAGVLAAGATVTHPASGYTTDLSELIGAPAGLGAVFGLAGFPEHSPFKDKIASIEFDGEPGGAGTVCVPVTKQVVFTESGTFEPTEGLLRQGGHVKVRVVGGGGGGNSYYSYSAGGGSGADITRHLSGITAPEPVTVGAGGVSGSRSGTSGEPSSFGTHVIAGGGGGSDSLSPGAAGGEGGRPGSVGIAVDSIGSGRGPGGGAGGGGGARNWDAIPNSGGGGAAYGRGGSGRVEVEWVEAVGC